MLLHPQFLWGLTATAVPVLIHLLARRRTRRVPFPSLRLLHAAERKRRTFSRLQRPLSLLLRILALALVALALAAPITGSLPDWLPLPRTKAVAILLDDTFSMTVPTEGRIPFERAKERAAGLVQTLGHADRVAMIAVSAPDEAVWTDPAPALRALDEAHATASAAKLGPALLRAEEMLREIAAPNRVALIATDLQAVAWQEPPVSAEGLGGITVIVADAGDEDVRNMAITDAELITSTALTDRPVRLRAHVATWSAGEPGETQRLVVQLLVDGRSVAASQQEVGVGAPAVAQFSFLAAEPADVPARFALTGGPFGAGVDDVRYLTVRARAAMQVLIVAAGDVGRYVATALNPFGDPGKTGMSPQIVGPTGLASALGEGPADVVVLADCPALGPNGVQALKSHAEGRGGILIFLGDGADATFVGKTLVPELTGDGSLVLGDVETAPAESPFGLTDIDTARQPLSIFANPRAGDLGALRFTKARKIEAGPAARVLASLDNGVPALLDWQAGRGRVVLLNMSADASWGQHIRSPAYVPLLHRLCGYAARPARPAIDDVLVGERPAIRGADSVPAMVSLRPPNGEERRVVVKDGLLPEVKVPGAYRARWDRHDIGFAANVDPRESDVSRIDRAAVTAALAPAQVEFLEAEADAGAARAALPARADLSVPLLVLALGIVLADAVLSIVRRGPDEGVGRTRVSTP